MTAGSAVAAFRAVAGAALLFAASAEAAPEKLESRSLGVVELRSGSAKLPGLGERLADIARKATNLRVTGPGDARKGSGLDVDALVVRCASDVGCLSSLGQRMGVRSLLVAAISQIGDIIVALQLIDVEGRRVAGRLAEALPPGSALGDDELRGWLGRILPAEAFQLWGTLSVRTDVSGATVEVDGTTRGMSPMLPLRLRAPQLYQLRITKPGRRSFGMTVDLQPERTIQVVATLPPRTVPLWKRPWVWALAAGGVATGAAVGIKLATPVPTTVDGNATVVRRGM